MSETKFTPGPWNVVQHGEGLYLCCTIHSESLDKPICIVGLEKQLTIANAALIAAAPEMYELLSEILEFEPRGIRLNFFDRINPIIEAVLRKARGESEVSG